VKLATLSSDATPDGVNSWTVDGTQVIRQQQFFFRIGNTGPGTDIASLAPSAIVPPVVLLSTSGSGPNNFASISYQGNGFTVNARYELLGFAAGTDNSDLIEQMIVTNVSTHTIQMNMADYADLNLSSPAGDDSAKVASSGLLIDQNGPNSTLAFPGATGLEAGNQAGITPTHYETGLGGTGAGTLVAGLMNGSAFPLNDNPSVSNTDAAFAQEYDQTINPGGSLVFSVAEVINPTVPEPASSAVLLGAGGIFFMRPRRRDEDPDARMVQVAGA